MYLYQDDEFADYDEGYGYDNYDDDYDDGYEEEETGDPPEFKGNEEYYIRTLCDEVIYRTV